MKRFFIEVAKIFFVIVALIVALNLYTLWSTRTITSVSAYEKIRNDRWSNQGLIRFFPKNIPQGAKEPKFYFRPGYMQGGSTIELRIRMPGKFVEKEIAKSGKNAKLIFKGEQELDSRADNPDMLIKSRFFTFPKEYISSVNPSALLPGDFVIYLLSSRPYETHPVSWNHGKVAGTSISKRRSEIIYWAENW